MSLIIEDPEAGRIIAEVAALTGASEMETLRWALLEGKERLGLLSSEERASLSRKRAEPLPRSQPL